jgi:hypothetical protein
MIQITDKARHYAQTISHLSHYRQQTEIQNSEFKQFFEPVTARFIEKNNSKQTESLVHDIRQQIAIDEEGKYAFKNGNELNRFIKLVAVGLQQEPLLGATNAKLNEKYLQSCLDTSLTAQKKNLNIRKIVTNFRHIERVYVNGESGPLTNLLLRFMPKLKSVVLTFDGPFNNRKLSLGDGRDRSNTFVVACLAASSIHLSVFNEMFNGESEQHNLSDWYNQQISNLVCTNESPQGGVLGKLLMYIDRSTEFQFDLLVWERLMQENYLQGYEKITRKIRYNETKHLLENEEDVSLIGLDDLIRQFPSDPDRYVKVLRKLQNGTFRICYSKGLPYRIGPSEFNLKALLTLIRNDIDVMSYVTAQNYIDNIVFSQGRHSISEAESLLILESSMRCTLRGLRNPKMFSNLMNEIDDKTMNTFSDLLTSMVRCDDWAVFYKNLVDSIKNNIDLWGDFVLKMNTARISQVVAVVDGDIPEFKDELIFVFRQRLTEF